MKGLRHAYKISIVLGMLYPVWKILLPKYVCTLEDVGLAMIQAATIGYSRKILENKDITLLAHSS